MTTTPPSKNDRRAVIQRELEWHEQESFRRHGLDSLLYDPPAFDNIVAAGVEFLDAKPGEKVLEIGCGEGKEALALAEEGLVVIGADLSRFQMQRARELIRQTNPNLCVHFVQANAEELPFAAGAFRIAYGKAILHHLDLENSAQEVNRILEPGGKAAFAEPLADHPMIWLGRRLTPKLRTQDERPLAYTAVSNFSRHFAGQQTETAFLLAPLAYFLRAIPGGESLFRTTHHALQQLDQALFAHWPGLKRFAWYAWVNITTN